MSEAKIGISEIKNQFYGTKIRYKWIGKYNDFIVMTNQYLFFLGAKPYKKGIIIGPYKLKQIPCPENDCMWFILDGISSKIKAAIYQSDFVIELYQKIIFTLVVWGIAEYHNNPSWIDIKFFKRSYYDKKPMHR